LFLINELSKTQIIKQTPNGEKIHNKVKTKLIIRAINNNFKEYKSENGMRFKKAMEEIKPPPKQISGKIRNKEIKNI